VIKKMATDGVKIIDGDLAHDTYWGIMDLYDSGTDLELIKKEYPLERSYYDEFNQEIYITAYALAFWEIGALTDKIIEQVRFAIDKAAGVKGWTEECGIETGKARQKELNKLWSKISTPKTKVRKQKKYRTITRFHYNQGDVLTFKGSDNFITVHIYSSSLNTEENAFIILFLSCIVVSKSPNYRMFFLLP
jgi:hypothetical protein